MRTPIILSLAALFFSCAPSKPIIVEKTKLITPRESYIQREECSDRVEINYGCKTEAKPYQLQPSESKQELQIPSPSQEPPDGRISIDIYFDPSCYGCNKYKKMLADEGLENKYKDVAKFNLICVELPNHWEEGRCQNQHNQDGKTNYDKLIARCEENKVDACCGGTPTVFFGNRQLRKSGWDIKKELEALVEKR